jgi:hypothetical protein
MILAALWECSFAVSLTFGNNQRYDLIKIPPSGVSIAPP